MLILSVAVAIITTVFLFLSPISFASLLGFTLYSFLLGFQLFKRKVSPIDAALGLVYLSMFFLVYFQKNEGFFPYSGTIFYGAFFCMALGSLLIGRPFTALMGDISTATFEKKHFVLTIVWTASFGFSALLSWVLMPGVWYILSPPLIMLGTAAVNFALNKLS